MITQRPPWGRSARLVGVVAVVFFGVAYASIVLTRDSALIAPFWPASAIGLVMLLRFAKSSDEEAASLAAIALASVAAHLLTGTAPVRAIVFGMENAAQIALSISLTRRFATTSFRSVAQGWRFFAAAGPPAALMGGVVMTGLAFIYHEPNPWLTGPTWAAADLLGFVLIGPIGMTISFKRVDELDLDRRWPEAAGIATLVLAVALGAFLQRALPLLFVVTPFLLLATFRFGLIGANAAVLLAASVAIPLTYLGSGPLALVHLNVHGVRLIVLQAFLALNGLTAVPIAAALEERGYLSSLAKRRGLEVAAINHQLLQTVRSAEFAERVAQMGYWRIETPVRKVVWSSGMYAMFGRDPSERPLSATEIAQQHAIEGGERLNAVEEAVQTRSDLDFEFVVDGPQGRRNLLVRARFVEHEDGGGTLLGVVRDVTEDRAKEARYRLLTENATDLVTEMGADGRFTYASPSLTAMTGYDVAEVVGRPAIDFIHPNDRPRVEEMFRTALQGPSGWRIEYRVICKDGRAIWVEARPTLVRDPTTGRPNGVTDVIRDITERKAAELALGSSEARYRLLAEGATDMICRYGLDGRIRYVSPASREVLGFTPEELIGKVTLDLIHPDDLARVRSQFAIAVAAPPDAPLIHTEHRVTRKDGREIWLEGRPRLVRDEEGRPFEYHDAMRDVTARKAMEAELSQAMVAAEAAAQAKADFLANMSHELRTPLNSIVGFSGLIASAPELNVETRRRAELVCDASRSLVTIVNDVLDLSKIEAEGVKLELGPVDLELVLEQTAELVREDAARKGLKLEVEVQRLFPPVLADPARLRQVLLNLLGNAIKFTAKGGVSLSLSETTQGRLRIAVRDTGVGIAPDRLSAIFDRFAQADGSTSRQFGGTGLGLTISRSIVTAMGGDLGVESREGEGSIFWFSFDPPLAESLPSSMAAIEGEAPDVRGARVLLADDNEVNRDLFHALMAGHGLHITDAADGAQAVAAAERERFDIVFMDVQMPVMDGLEATRTLRSQGVDTPIVALSANVMAAQVEAFRQAGMDAHLSKPYAAIDVLRLIAAQTPTAVSAPAEETVSQATLAGLKASLGQDALETFLGRLADQLRGVGAMLAATGVDPADLAQSVHAVRGLAGTLGFGAVNGSYATLEARCLEGCGIDDEVLNALRVTHEALDEIGRLRAA